MSTYGHQLPMSPKQTTSFLVIVKVYVRPSIQEPIMTKLEPENVLHNSAQTIDMY
jgi:hypothetical protein